MNQAADIGRHFMRFYLTMPRDDRFGREVDMLPVVNLPFSGFESKVLADLEYFLNRNVLPLVKELEKWKTFIMGLQKSFLFWMSQPRPPTGEDPDPRAQRLYLWQQNLNGRLQEAWHMLSTGCFGLCFPALLRLLLSKKCKQEFVFLPDNLVPKPKYASLKVNPKKGKPTAELAVNLEYRYGYAMKIYATPARVIQEFDRLPNVLLNIEMTTHCNDVQQWLMMPRWVHYLGVWYELFDFILAKMTDQRIPINKWRVQVDKWIKANAKQQ